MANNARGRNIHLRVNVNGDSHHHDYFRISGSTKLDVFTEKVRLALLPEEISRVDDCIRDAFGARVIDLSALTDGEVLWFCPQGSKNTEAASHHKDPFFEHHSHHHRHHHGHHGHHSSNHENQEGLATTQPQPPAGLQFAQVPVGYMPINQLLTSTPVHNWYGSTNAPETQPFSFPEDEPKDKPVIRWEDILIGPAIGDAFGSGIAGQPSDWISSNVDYSTFINVKNSSDLGKYSLSTEQMIGTVRCLLEKAEETFKQGSPLTRDLFAEYWRREENHNRSRYGSGRFGRQEGESQGSEVLVRSLPIGYMGSDIPALLVETTNATLEDLGNRPRLAAWVVAILVEAVVIKSAKLKREYEKPCSQ